VRKNNLISLISQHKVASNILMLLLLFSGIWAISKLNTQFLPTFQLDVIQVQIIWPGASAADIEKAITIPVEQELTSINYVKEMTSTSAEGVSTIALEFVKNADIDQALEDVKQKVNLIRNLPLETEPPLISKVERFENIASLIIYGPKNIEALRPLAYEFKRTLLAKGIAKISLIGLPDLEIVVPLSSEILYNLNQSIPQIAERLSQESTILPAGTAGEDEWGHAIKSPGQYDNPYDFSELSLQGASALRLPLKQVVNIHERAQKNEVLLTYQGMPAIELKLQRTEGADSLRSAKILEEWLSETRALYGDSVKMLIYDQSWKPIFERISLLIKNGSQGLFLIIITLFLFLEKRIAFWVAIGIPVSFSAALGLLYLFGGSINMVSLFALIMTLGIIVDDTIVVGENAYWRIQNGVPAHQAAPLGALRMLTPVIASSLTTIAAFLPLMMIGGIIGSILFDIPFVAICVILASLLECFFILPGHIAHSFSRSTKKNTNTSFLERVRISFDQKFTTFRDEYFTGWVDWSLRNKPVSLSISLAILVVVLSLPLTGRVGFNFFPAADSGIINAHIQFVAGTPQKIVQQFVKSVESALNDTVAEVNEKEKTPILLSALSYYNQGVSVANTSSASADHLASIKIELTTPDQRNINNNDFISQWKEKVIIPPGLEKFTIFSRRGGPPGQDIEIDLIGTDAKKLKQASLELQKALSSFDGVFNIGDNLPYGKPELIYRLTPQAESLNITIQSLGQQLRAAFDGTIIQIVNDQEDEIEIRAILPEVERRDLATLGHYPILTPTGQMVPLNTVAYFEEKTGLAELKHSDGLLVNRVSAELDSQQILATDVLAFLEQNTLSELIEKYGIEYKLKGKSEDQAQTLGDMGRGVFLAVALIYLILTWVFSSYSQPLVVMAILPFGITGAIFGHWVMGMDMTILSLFGFFGLAGIVVNDSIILVSFYHELIAKGMKMQHAIVEATRLRLRAVILTSVTTIAGLLPLLFETSVQAQFLIPMAISICFGLFFTTFLVLFMIPILLLLEEKARISIRWKIRHYGKTT
tara:strand:+ start:34961 stop:38104 length:3144 start_codon:yes stop_codon:yes gene_type:complete